MSFFNKMIEIAKSMGVKNFAFYKKWALDHLKKQLDEEETVTKALEYCEEYLEKAYGVGTIREWKGKKYIKGPDKKWRRYYEKHGRGANQAIKSIMRQINALEDGDVEGLYAIIQKNQGRFRDGNGNILPEVQQIHDLVDKKQSGSEKQNSDIEKYKKLQDELKQEIADGKRNNTKELQEDVNEWKNLLSIAEKRPGAYSKEQTEHFREIIKIGEAELSKRKEGKAKKEEKKDPTKEITEGSVVRFKENLEPGDENWIGVVLEDRGDTVVVQDVQSKMTIKPQHDYSKKDLVISKDAYKEREEDTHYWIQDPKGNRLTNIEAKKRIKNNLDQIDSFNDLMEGRSKAENARTEIAKRSLEVDNNRLMERLNAEDRKEMKSEFEKHQNRSNAMKGNQNAKKDGITEDEKKEKTFDGASLDTVMEKYANDKLVKKAVKDVSDMDFTSEDETKSFMAGTYQEDGYKIATDGRYLSMIKSDYPAEEEGKIKGNEKILKYNDKKIEQYKVNVTEAEDDLKRAAETKGTGSRDYEFAEKKLTEAKENLKRVENVKKTGFMDGTFPNYKKVIPSLGNNPNYGKVKGFDDFNKVLKNAMVAAAFAKNTKYPLSTIKVGDSVFDAQRLVKVMAMAKKYDLNEIIGNKENPDAPIEFKGEKGSVVIMPMYGSTTPMFDANTGAVNIEDQDKKEEFLSGGEKETRLTFAKNKSKYETKFDKDIIDIMNHFEKQKGLTVSKYYKDHNYIRTAKNPAHISNEGNEDFKNAMNDLKDLFQDYQGFITDVYNRRFEEGKENKNVSSKEIKKFFEDGVKKIKDKYGIQKSFLEQIEEISKSVKEKSQPEQKHDLEYYKKWAMSILDKQKEEPEEDGPNEETIVKALAYTEMIAKAGYPVGTIREWKGQKYIKIAPNKWKPKYDNMGSRGAKMSLTNLKKAVAKCNSEEELFNLINSNASRFRDENGRPFPEVQELHDLINKRQDEINTPENNVEKPENGSVNENGSDNGNTAPEDSGKEPEKKKKTPISDKISAIQNAGNKGKMEVEKLSQGNVEGVAADAGDDTVNAVKNAAKEEEKKPVAAQEVSNMSFDEKTEEPDEENFDSLTEKYNATKDPDERESILNKIMALQKEKNDTIKDMKEQRKEDLTQKYSETTDPDEREKILNEMMNLDRQDEEKILPAMFDKEDEGFDAWDKDQKAKYGDKSVEELQKLLDTKYKNVKKYTPEYSEAMKIGDMIQQKKRQKK